MDCDFEDKYLLMYSALEQDCDELQEEAAAVATLLQQAKEKKLRLQAEIKFLKKRAAMLRGSMRYPDPYFTREAVGEGPQYGFGSSQVLPGRVMFADLQVKTTNTTPVNMFHRPHSYSLPSGNRQQPDVVGVLKTSSKQGANGIAQAKKVGKRKISWQDDFSVKA